MNAASVKIDAKGMHYKELNQIIEDTLNEGVQHIELVNVNGQRYIGDGLTFPDRKISIYGTPGNDMAAFMNGLTIEVFANAQDAIANTMNDGTIIVHGSAGDILGYGMRGGEVFIKEDVGYRVGIHMKEYKDKIPVLVVGGKAGDFLGEYMAGGRIIVLGLNLQENEPITGLFCGTGMHGGIIYLRGQIEEYKLGKEVKVVDMQQEDYEFLDGYISRYVKYFGYSKEFIMSKPFYKLIPYNKRPYGKLYAY